MKEFKELMRVLFAVFRYPAAIVVAFVASMATVFYLPLLQNGDSDGWFFFWFFCMGLAGVATGSFCLPRKQWWIGSLCLLFLGLGFAFFVFCAVSEDDSGANLFPLVPLATGGIIPVVIHFLFRNKRRIETLL
jgi:hypothetical protein